MERWDELAYKGEGNSKATEDVACQLATGGPGQIWGISSMLEDV